jgi:acetyl esterase/lipase
MKGENSIRPIWLATAFAVVLTGLSARKVRQLKDMPPDLRSPLLLASPLFSPAFTRWLQRVTPTPKVPPKVRLSEHFATRGDKAPPVRVLIFERSSASSERRPAMLWMHGGGYVVGTPEQDMAFISLILDGLDVAIVSVDYRLAPDHPFPLPLDDCYAAWGWLIEHVAELNIDLKRIAIGGQSAGAGLAAALVQRVIDDGAIAPVFQLLLYPMLDTRTVARSDHGGTGLFVWTPRRNKSGWESYLGRDSTTDDQPRYAVPAIRSDLAGLPPAWIGVGTLDLFYAEDLAYADALRKAGVSCVSHITEGGYHAFDVLKPRSAATQKFYESMLSTLAQSFGLNSSVRSASMIAPVNRAIE